MTKTHKNYLQNHCTFHKYTHGKCLEKYIIKTVHTINCLFDLMNECNQIQLCIGYESKY